MLTGESLPREKQTDDKVYAATLNQQGRLKCRALAVGSHTQLATIIRLVEQAQGSKADIQKLADRVSAVFCTHRRYHCAADIRRMVDDGQRF